jgi:ribosomal protein S7
MKYLEALDCYKKLIINVNKRIISSLKRENINTKLVKSSIFLFLRSKYSIIKTEKLIFKKIRKFIRAQAYLSKYQRSLILKQSMRSKILMLKKRLKHIKLLKGFFLFSYNSDKNYILNEQIFFKKIISFITSFSFIKKFNFGINFHLEERFISKIIKSLVYSHGDLDKYYFYKTFTQKCRSIISKPSISGYNMDKLLYSKLLGKFTKKGCKRKAINVIQRALLYASRSLKISVSLVLKRIYAALRVPIETKKIKMRRSFSVIPFYVNTKRKLYLISKWLLLILKKKGRASAVKALSMEIIKIIKKNPSAFTLKVRASAMRSVLRNRSNLHYRW